MHRPLEKLLCFSVVLLTIVMVLPAWGSLPLVLDEHAAYWLSAPDGSLSITERSLRYAAAPPLTCWVSRPGLVLPGAGRFIIARRTPPAES